MLVLGKVAVVVAEDEEEQEENGPSEERPIGRTGAEVVSGPKAPVPKTHGAC
jgi:hypothetical protein